MPLQRHEPRRLKMCPIREQRSDEKTVKAKVSRVKVQISRAFAKINDVSQRCESNDAAHDEYRQPRQHSRGGLIICCYLTSATFRRVTTEQPVERNGSGEIEMLLHRKAPGMETRRVEVILDVNDIRPQIPPDRRDGRVALPGQPSRYDGYIYQIRRPDLESATNSKPAHINAAVLTVLG